jgi:glucose-6-phosphate-specific signal transduction histidine kinase
MHYYLITLSSEILMIWISTWLILLPSMPLLLVGRLSTVNSGAIYNRVYKNRCKKANLDFLVVFLLTILQKVQHMPTAHYPAEVDKHYAKRR